MAEIAEYHNDFQSWQTDVFALSTDHPDASRAVKKEMNLPFELLCDPERQMVKTWGLLNPFEHGGVAVPAIIIVNQEGRISFMSVGGTATRTRVPEILSFLKVLADDGAHVLNLEKGTRIVIPSGGALLQLGRNFVLRGNAADWRHFFLWPLGYVKKAGAFIVRKVIGSK